MKNILYLLYIVAFLTIHTGMNAQDNPLIKVSGVVRDDAGNVLKHIPVIASGSKQAVSTNAEGVFEIEVRVNDALNIHAEGYEQNVVQMEDGILQENEIVMYRNQHLQPEKMISLPFGELSHDRLTGSAIVISGDELRHFGGNDIYEALRGKVAGLKMQGNSINGRVYGPTVLVDGLIKPIEYVNIQTVEEVIYMPDLDQSAAMGALGNNGILYIRTKTGKKGVNEIEVDYQHGMDMAAQQPKYMDAYNYAATNNQMRMNDGLTPLYDQAALDAYKNGSDPVYYPTLDLRSTLLNDMYQKDQVGALMLGGFNQGDYYFYGGLESSKGLEKVGEQSSNQNFIFDSRLNMSVNDIIKAKFGVVGNYKTTRSSTYGTSAMMKDITNTAPNAFPLQLGDSVYIASQQFPTNPYANLVEGGYIKTVTSNIMFNGGLEFDLGLLVNGLKYDADVMVNNFSSYGEKLKNEPEIKRIDGIDEMGNPILGLLQPKTRQTSPSKDNPSSTRLYTLSGNLNYNLDKGDNKLSASLIHYLYWGEWGGKTPDSKYLFYSLNANYMFKNKYVLDGTLNYTGSTKYASENRYKAFPTIGLGWIISREGFLQDSKAINFLKFRGSYGITGSDPGSDYLFQSIWGSGQGSLYYGIDNKGQKVSGLRPKQTGNPDLMWTTITQLSAGFDARLFNNKVTLQGSYFDREIDGGLSNMNRDYSSMLGDFGVYLPTINATRKKFEGIEANLVYSNRVGSDFSYTFGVNYSYFKVTDLTNNDIIYPDLYRNTEGRESDLIFGLENDGLFSETPADNNQMFGSVKEGDIRYKDQNGDELVDNRDFIAVGNKTPRHNLGLNLNLKYKGWNLYVAGYALAGYDLNLNGHQYYQPSGYENYPVNISTLPNGNAMPRLSISDNNNNFKNSDYWLVDGTLFRLNTAELGYTLPVNAASKVFCKSIKLFARANNLLVVSKLNDLDPEYMYAGISSYPRMRTILLGTTIRF